MTIWQGRAPIRRRRGSGQRQIRRRYGEQIGPVLDAWIDDEDLWIRRTALLAQKGMKGETDVERLFGYCQRVADQEEFFIQKAIGWALRDYARTNPQAVKRFLEEWGGRLSNLAVREASKYLKG